MLVVAVRKRVLRTSRRQVVEAVASEDVGSKVECDSEYCRTRRVEPAGRAAHGLVHGIMEDGVPEVLLDALEEQYHRARAAYGEQDHGHRRAGVRIEPIGDYFRPPAQSL